MKALFIPLKTEYYEAFERGDKTHEYRMHGVRWNKRTCSVGRAVTLSKGYGKKHRLNAVIKSFELKAAHTCPPEFLNIYAGKKNLVAAVIELDILR